MRKFGLMICLVAGVATIMTSQAEAQRLHSRLHSRLGTRPVYNGMSAEAMTTTNDVGCVTPLATAGMALHNPFTPNRLYTYSNRGIEAGLTHQWNQQEALGRNWHGNYQYWRYGEPTALVVPPTASYQTSYGWGVGQTRMYPIHHQFGKAGAGIIGGGGNGMFSRTPYWPSHTDQFGIYSVRAPW
jgi:hypothetical protein